MTTVDKKIFRLEGKVQHYAWGGYTFLPHLLGLPESTKPSAEYWMGAHPSAPSVIYREGDQQTTLDQLIKENPQEVLGSKVWDQFRELPYLFKILDVKDMLSIQVHPTKEEAEKGFARENEAGVPLNAPDRNYKDANHKPEIMVALSEFWLLHGFLPEEKLQEVWTRVPELSSLKGTYEKEGYYGLYKKVMEMPQDEVNALLLPLAEKILPPYRANELAKSDPAFWAARAIMNDPHGAERPDRGIFSIYFFNIVGVEPGDAVFQDAGIPHAYLEGQNIELMANSDNVLRGGLTPKHIDVPELLKHTRFEAVHPDILKGEAVKGGLERIYETPAPDFAVSLIKLKAGDIYENTSQAAEILIAVKGAAVVTGTGKLDLEAGQSVFITANTRYRIGSDGTVEIYKATVPVR
jgi:mannose-6-phosphate isomerase